MHHNLSVSLQKKQTHLKQFKLQQIKNNLNMIF